MAFEKSGNWARGVRVVNAARWKSLLLKELGGQTKNAADVLKKRIQDGINNSERAPGLAQSTMDKKGHGIVLLDSGVMVNSITSKKVGSESYFAGLPHSSVHFEIGVYHEIMAKRIPIRKFVEPAAEEVRPQLEDEFGSAFEKVFREGTA